MNAAYAELVDHFCHLYHLDHLAAICRWDRAALMPSGGSEARAAALAEYARIRHDRLTAPLLQGLFDRVENESLTQDQRANVQEMRRLWQRANALPASLVEARVLAAARCEHAWRDQRVRNDWTGFRENFEPVVRLGRETAERLAEALGLGAYESLVDLYEPGMRCARLDRLFADIKTWLPALIASAGTPSDTTRLNLEKGRFPAADQHRLGQMLMSRLGFDHAHGRLDTSVHPFCGGVTEDVRITSRYNEADFSDGLMAVVHETGHGCYEQNLPLQWRTQPAGRARSMGIHESQSLLYEMQLARRPAFLEWLGPELRTHFPTVDIALFEPEYLQRHLCRVRPGLIRVLADEVTYPAHILLRYEIERDLIEAQIETDDIPAVWDMKMQQYLGLSSTGDYRDGCLQDIHWAEGTFGYFPSYLLGAITAAQLFVALYRTIPDLDEQLRDGLFAVVIDWLRQAVWCHGSLLGTDELIHQATGAPLSVEPFRQHLEQRYASDRVERR